MKLTPGVFLGISLTLCFNFNVLTRKDISTLTEKFQEEEKLNQTDF